MNAGKPWDVESNNVLLDNVKLGKSIVELSEICGRTTGSIYAKLKSIAVKHVESGATIEQAHENVNKLIDINCIKIKDNDQKLEKNPDKSLEQYLLDYANIQEKIAKKKHEASMIQVKIRTIMLNKTTNGVKK